ncbi:MAG: polymer-forming cytoskeletal protein [Hydrogenophaga sp.]|nr:polymer-forming cytoskeletal protein [Hydrogenophaga sp.]
MALHFGKRESELPKPLNTGMNPQRYGVTPGSAPGQPQGAPATSSAPEAPSSSAAKPAGSETSGSKLTVGPNIKLKGVEITDCDTLVVEGMVEATMDSRVIQIAEQGEFKGSAEIDIAEIHGAFDGNLTVRQKLVIYATGRVTGTIRYGKVVIEEGGQLSGDIECTLGGTRSASKQTQQQPAQPSMALAA